MNMNNQLIIGSPVVARRTDGKKGKFYVHNFCYTLLREFLGSFSLIYFISLKLKLEGVRLSF
jgi:hypothetical protein